MTKPKELKVGDGAKHDIGYVVKVIDIDMSCIPPQMMVEFPNGSVGWEPLSKLRKLPDRKEGP